MSNISNCEVFLSVCNIITIIKCVTSIHAQTLHKHNINARYNDGMQLFGYAIKTGPTVSFWIKSPPYSNRYLFCMPTTVTVLF